MMKRILLAAAVSFLAFGASAQASRKETVMDAPHRAEILGVVDAFFIALGSADADAMEAMSYENSFNVISAPEAGNGVTYRPMAKLIEQMRADDFPVIRERYWDPIVLERGDLAVVWAPYSIDIDGARSHCGVDVFNLSKHQEGWVIDGLSFTREPEACNEINPGDASIARPDYSVLDAKEN